MAINSIPVEDVKILVGNHDWLKQGQEFFRFLNHLPHVQYINKPTEDQDLEGPLTFYLPYSKNPMRDWSGMDFSHYEYLFMHQTMSGSISSNGQAMEGDEMPELNAGKVWSGDIHVPQVIGPVEYCGSPYHVHFGDKFKPRCVLIEKGGRTVDLHFETISRVVVKVSSLRELKRMTFRAGDQVKLRIELSEAEKHEWSKLRRECVNFLKDAGVVVASVELIVKRSSRRLLEGLSTGRVSHSPADELKRFVMAEELGADALDFGLNILEAP